MILFDFLCEIPNVIAVAMQITSITDISITNEDKVVKMKFFKIKTLKREIKNIEIPQRAVE